MTAWSDLGLDPSELPPGNSYHPCPRCSSERSKSWKPCLSVHRERGAFHCHHCGWRGYVDGVQGLVTDVTDWGATSYAAAPARELTELPPEVLEWWHARGISRDTLERNGVQWGVGFRSKAGEEFFAMFFPYYRNGEVINRKRRRFDSKQFLLEKGCEILPWGLDHLDPAVDEVILTEGEPDKLSWNEAGIWNVLSVPNGAPPAEAQHADTHLKWLESPHLERLHGRVRRWILDVDADGPGRTLEQLLARRLGRERVWVTRKPSGCKDANDVLVAHGPAGVRELLERARPFPVAGIYEAEDPLIVEALEADYEDDNPTPGYSLGLASLDPLMRVQPGNFIVLTGIPGMGKGEFVDQVAINLADQYGWRTAFFSPENSPVHRHVRKLIEKRVGLSMRAQFGPAQKMGLEQMREARAWVDEHFSFVLPAEGDWRLESLLKLFEHALYRKGVRSIVIDPWNEISHVRVGGERSETDAINEELSKIKRFGQKNELLVWVVAHPTKLQPRTQDGADSYPVPKLYDVSGSAHFANRADFGLAVHRDFGRTDQNGHQNFLDVHVLKARWKDLGQPGMARLQWDRVSGRLTSDLSRLVVPPAFQAVAVDVDLT